MIWRKTYTRILISWYFSYMYKNESYRLDRRLKSDIKTESLWYIKPRRKFVRCEPRSHETFLKRIPTSCSKINAKKRRKYLCSWTCVLIYSVCGFVSIKVNTSKRMREEIRLKRKEGRKKKKRLITSFWAIVKRKAYIDILTLISDN